jgi:hypothetical protein
MEVFHVKQSIEQVYDVYIPFLPLWAPQSAEF